MYLFDRVINKHLFSLTFYTGQTLIHGNMMHIDKVTILCEYDTYLRVIQYFSGRLDLTKG